MIARESLAEIGNFNKPHGIKGEISASFDADILPEVAAFGHIFVELDGLMVPFTILSTRPKSSETLLLTLKGINDEKQAGALSNHSIYIEESLMPLYDDDSADGFYIDDLVGFDLISDGKQIGMITQYDDSTENVLFIVETQSGAELLVPASEQLIEEINTDTKTVTMYLPAGLLNIND